MKKTARVISIILCVCMLVPALVACSGKSDENTVIVYTSTEDYRIDDFKNAVKLLNLISFPEILVVNLNPKTFYEVLKTKQSQQF